MYIFQSIFMYRAPNTIWKYGARYMKPYSYSFWVSGDW